MHLRNTLLYLDAAAGIASGDARVAFVTVCNGIYDYMYMDDITVKDIPPCPEPIGLSLAGNDPDYGYYLMVFEFCGV